MEGTGFWGSRELGDGVDAGEGEGAGVVEGGGGAAEDVGERVGGEENGGGVWEVEREDKGRGCGG